MAEMKYIRIFLLILKDDRLSVRNFFPDNPAIYLTPNNKNKGFPNPLDKGQELL
jgi:hypothetical protein